MKNLSKLVAGFLAILLSVTMVACTGTENVSAVGGGEEFDDSALIIDSVDDPSPIELVEPEPEPVVVDPEPELQSEPEEPEEQPEVDPNEELTWQFLEVDEDWYKEYQGMGLRREGKLYSLSDGVPAENMKKTGLGFKNGNNATSISYGDVSNEYIIVDDRFVIPAVSADDDLAWYGKPIGTLKLVPMEFYGYTVPINRKRDSNDNTIVVYNSQDSSDTFSINGDNGIYLFDENGDDVLNDYRNLAQGEEYTLKWSEGEKTLIAHWCYYKPTGDQIIVTGKPTEDSLIEAYDFSNVPSGIYYAVESYALIEVK